VVLLLVLLQKHITIWHCGNDSIDLILELQLSVKDVNRLVLHEEYIGTSFTMHTCRTLGSSC